MKGLLARLGAGESIPVHDTTRRHQDGHVVDVSLSIAPIQAADGEVIGFASISRDVAERRAAERNLARYRTIVKTSSEAILAVRLDGRIISWNPAALGLVGLTVKEIAERPLATLAPPERQAEVEALLARVAEGEPIEDHETIWLHESGFAADVALTLSPIRDADKTVIAAAVLGRDITAAKAARADLRQTAEELKRSNEELERFAYVVSHDLRAPMRAIDRLSSWILEDAADSLDEASKERLGLLRGRVTRMDRLVDDLLAYSRAGRPGAEPERVNVAAVVSEVKGLLSPPPGMRIISTPLPWITTVRAPVTQVFQNLIGNAIKHHDRDEGTISIECDEEEDRFVFRVIDDGPGIEPRYHEKIFEIFQTLTEPGQKTDSTGIGLAIVARIIQARGGALTVDSDGQRGTTFEFSWPKEPIS